MLSKRDRTVDSLLSILYVFKNARKYELERGKGIEPSALAWKARVLPLYEPRFETFTTSKSNMAYVVFVLRNQDLS